MVSMGGEDEFRGVEYQTETLRLCLAGQGYRNRNRTLETSCVSMCEEVSPKRCLAVNP